jgi:hypothetical protein
VKFKNKVYNSNYRKINTNSLLHWNSNFWFSFARNLCFLA